MLPCTFVSFFIKTHCGTYNLTQLLPSTSLLCLATIAQLQAIVNAQYASTLLLFAGLGCSTLGPSACSQASTVAQQGYRAS